jgi:hypothetical protein
MGSVVLTDGPYADVRVAMTAMNSTLGFFEFDLGLALPLEAVSWKLAFPAAAEARLPPATAIALLDAAPNGTRVEVWRSPPRDAST